MSKKNGILIRIILLSFLVISLLAFMLFSLYFGSGKFKKSFKFHNKSKLVYTKDYNIENINSIRFDLQDADLIIRSSDNENLIKVDVYDEDENNFVIDENNTTLSLNFDFKSSFCFGICYVNRKVILYLPNNFDKSMEAISTSGDINVGNFSNLILSIDTTSGDISVREVDNLKIKTISGDVNVDKSKDLNVKTTSGDIEIFEVDAVDLETTSGEIDVYKINSRLNVNSTSGEVELNNVMLSQNSKINTVSGDVEVSGINLVNILTSSVSGDIEVYRSDKNSSISLEVKTISGDIEIE